MNIHINMVMHTLVKEPVELVKTLAGPDTFWHIFVHSRIPEVVAAAEGLREYGAVRVEQVGINRGLSRSWNEGMAASWNEGADAVLVANDDTSASREDMLRLAEAAVDCRTTHYFITGDGLHVAANVRGSMQLALGAFTRLAFDVLGMMDSNLFPCYWEDSDYYARAARAGLQAYSIGQTNIVHLGEQTIRVNPQVRRQLEFAVPRNEAWIIEKWGGALGSFTYQHPFNDESIGLRIAPENRHRPYPGHDRQDFDEVMAIE